MNNHFSCLGNTLGERLLNQGIELPWFNEIVENICKLPSEQIKYIYETGLTEKDCLELFDVQLLDMESLSLFVKEFNSVLNRIKETSIIEEEKEIMINWRIYGLFLIALSGMVYYLNRKNKKQSRNVPVKTSNPKPNSLKMQEGERIMIMDEHILCELKEIFRGHSQGLSFFSGNQFIINETSCARLDSYGYFKPESIEKLQKLLANARNEIQIICPKVGELFDNSIAKTITPYTGETYIKEVISLGLQKSNGTVILPAYVETITKTQD